MPYIESSNGINWFYEIKGQGKVLVFLHGWAFDSRVWSRQVSDFVDYKVVTLDLPGHGDSDYKQGIDTIKDLNFVFEKLALENINLIGHSWGGFLALKFALSYPELINKITLIGTNAKFVKSDDYKYGLSESQVNKLKGFLTDSYPDILLVFMRWLFSNREHNQSDFREVWDFISKRKVWPNKEALNEFLSVIEKEDLRKDLNKINKLTLIISGTQDPICPVQSLEFLNQQIKSSKAELFGNCGHMPFLTQPQKFNKLVKEFLE